MGAQTYVPIEILDYVETHAPPEDSPFGISQRELAKALGYHPCSMSRPLDSLVRGGLLNARRSLVRDGIRRQITYRLTEIGRSRLRRETREVPLLSGEIPPPPHPFLGRKDEMAQLMEYSHQPGSITFVDGPPGMGKTALVSRHLRRIKQGRIPFWFAVRPASSPRQFVTALSHALSFLGAPQLAYYTQLPRPPEAREVADLAARALGDRSLAAVVDDLQMAGPDMRKFLSEFLQVFARNRDHQFFLVGQEAPNFAPPGLPTNRLTVGGLDRTAAHDLTDRQGGLAERFETVFQATLGSPLLLQLAVSNPEIDADAASLPAAVVKRLTIKEVGAVLPVALASEPLPLTFVVETPTLDTARLNELVRAGILHRTLQGRVEVLQVVRAALLARVAPSEEREAHLRLARFYSRSRRPEAVRERFLHLVEGEAGKPAANLLSQQQRVLLRLGYSETLRSALRHLATVLPRGPSRVRVLTVEAVLLKAHSDYSEAIVALRRAIAESNDDPRTTCESLLAIVDLHLRLRQVNEAREEFDKARQIGASTRRLQAFFALSEARILEALGDNPGAQSQYQSAFEMARKSKNGDLALEGIAAWSRLAELQSGPDVALQLISDALPEARQAGRMDIVFNLLLVRARAYARTGHEALAESEMKLIRSEADALGHLNQLTYALSGLAAMATEGRRWGEAINFAKQAITMAERLGNDLVLGHTLALLCTTELRQALFGGEVRLLPEAILHGERSIDVLSRLPPSDSLALAHAYLAELFAFQANREKAVQHYRSAMETAERLNLDWLKASLTSEVGPKVHALEPSSLADRPAADASGH